MNMTNRIRLTIAFGLLWAAWSTAAFASDNAYLYLLQGIPGRDYSAATDPEFPVDVLLNDEVCYERGLTFGTIAGPLTLAPGSYDVKVSAANSLAPCSNSPIVDSTVTLTSGENVSAVLALASGGTPTLDTFTNKFTPVAANSGRILFALAADSPAVQVILENTTTKKLYTYSVNPGSLLNVTLPSGTYALEVNQATTTIASTTFDLYSQAATMVFAVGQASNGTVNLETKNVRNLI
jgi:Domain of unknown function (DUF4397)